MALTTRAGRRIPPLTLHHNKHIHHVRRTRCAGPQAHPHPVAMSRKIKEARGQELKRERRNEHLDKQHPSSAIAARGRRNPILDTPRSARSVEPAPCRNTQVPLSAPAPRRACSATLPRRAAPRRTHNAMLPRPSISLVADPHCRACRIYRDGNTGLPVVAIA